MTPRAPSVVFRVAAGPRLGYGHLVRVVTLARAMGVRPVVSLRGGADAGRVARQLGCRLAGGTPAPVLRAARARLLVLDDPSARHAAAWRRAAARLGVPCASIHDLGLAACGADLAIDGSVVAPRRRLGTRTLHGPRFAILAASTRCRRAPRRPTVLVALGGGPRRRTAQRLAAAIRKARPDVHVRIASGFVAAPRERRGNGVVWLGPQRGLVREFSTATVAVVAGGVTLYEACATGTPAVAAAVVPAQRPTIRGFARKGAAVDGGSAAAWQTASRRVLALLEDASWQRRLSAAGRALVDGRGAHRAARALDRLARTRVVAA